MKTVRSPKACKDSNIQYRCQQSKGKLLPHIVGQYEYRITNKLLIQKIINPKRDRIIMDSLANTSHRYILNGNKNTLTNKSILLRKKKNEEGKYIKYGSLPKQQEHSIENEIDKNKIKNEDMEQKYKDQEDNQSPLFGKIKKNNYLQTHKNTCFLIKSNKSGQIRHQSCEKYRKSDDFQSNIQLSNNKQILKDSSFQKENELYDFQGEFRRN